MAAGWAGSDTLPAFLFFGNKNLATGEGGMLTTDDDDRAVTVRQLLSPWQ